MYPTRYVNSAAGDYYRSVAGFSRAIKLNATCSEIPSAQLYSELLDAVKLRNYYARNYFRWIDIARGPSTWIHACISESSRSPHPLQGRNLPTRSVSFFGRLAGQIAPAGTKGVPAHGYTPRNEFAALISCKRAKLHYVLLRPRFRVSQQNENRDKCSANIALRGKLAAGTNSALEQPHTSGPTSSSSSRRA